MAQEFERGSPRTDEEGYLLDPGEWSEELAELVARREGIALTEEHWIVIRFIRDYYETRQIAPDARHAIRHLAKLRGEESGGRNELFALFPYGYVKQACKIAGMRKPRAWSTG